MNKKWWRNDPPTVTEKICAIITAPGWMGDLVAVGCLVIGIITGCAFVWLEGWL